MCRRTLLVAGLLGCLLAGSFAVFAVMVERADIAGFARIDAPLLPGRLAAERAAYVSTAKLPDAALCEGRAVRLDPAVLRWFTATPDSRRS